MRILFLSHQAKFIYGGEVCSLAMMQALSDKQEIYFAAPKGIYFDRAQKIVKKCFPIFSIQFRRSIVSLVQFLPCFFVVQIQLIKIITKHKVQIVHATSLKAFVYAVMCKLWAVKVIWHHHDIMPDTFTNKYWLKVLSFFCHQIIVPSQATKAALLRAGINGDKIQVIYNGLDIHQWRTHIPGLNPILQLGFIGELSQRKGIDWIAPIAAGLLTKDIKFKFTIAGATNDEQDFFEKVKNENKLYINQGYIEFVGRTEDVKGFLQKLDILLVPSREDPFPTVIIEAFLSGVPVLARKVGGIPELLKDMKTGFFCDSPLAFVDQISILNKDRQLLKELSIEARKHAEFHLSVEVMAKKLNQLYLSITNS